MFDADRVEGVSRWQLVRLRPGATTECVLLSDAFFPVTTHWVGHTVLCAGDDCPLCDVFAARGLFYLAVHWDGRVSMLELGAQSASWLEQHLKLLHSGLLPGSVVRLSRRTLKSPVHSECVGIVPKHQVVPTLELARRVMAIYKFPPPQPTEDIVAYDLRCSRLARVRGEQILQRSKATSSGRVESR